MKLGRVGLDYSRKTKGLIYAVIDTEKSGTGRKPTSVYAGIASEDEKGVGLKVTDLYEDGPAKAAGLLAGDIIVSIDGTKIADYDAFTALLAEKKAGDVVKITVKRGGKDAKDVTVDLKLAPRPGNEDTTPKGKGGGGKGGQGGGQPGPQPGTTLMPGFTPAVALEGPVKVASVPKDGPADKAGVKAGMDIVAIDGKAVASFREFLTELRVSPRAENPRQAGDKVKVKFQQDKKELEVELALRGVEAVILSASVQLTAEQSAVKLAETALDAARRNADETGELYRQGLANALEVADANQRLFEAEVAAVTTRYRMAAAYLALREASGEGAVE